MICLIEFAREEFRLGKLDKDGKSLRETLQVVERMTGRMPAEGVNSAEFPDVLWDLWRCFCDLSSTRPKVMGSVSRITFQELSEYASLMRIQFKPWEVRALLRLDELACDSFK